MVDCGNVTGSFTGIAWGLWQPQQARLSPSSLLKDIFTDNTEKRNVFSVANIKSISVSSQEVCV